MANEVQIDTSAMQALLAALKNVLGITKIHYSPVVIFGLDPAAKCKARGRSRKSATILDPRVKREDDDGVVWISNISAEGLVYKPLRTRNQVVTSSIQNN